MFIDRLIGYLLPRQAQFFTLLDEIAQSVALAAATFARLAEVDASDGLAAIAQEMRTIEHNTDQLAHRLYEELDKTFVTPIDREDLHSLTSAMDDIVDTMEHGTACITLYRLNRLTDPMRQLVRIAHSTAAEIVGAIGLLRDSGNYAMIQRHVVNVNSLENEGDQIYRKELERLFTERTDPLDLVRQKDILNLLEESIDACEDVMDVIRSVVVKNG